MKTIAASIVLILATTAAYADTEKCSVVGEIAQSIMELRQANMPMSELMSAFDGVEAGELAKIMISDAYSRSSYSTEQVQNRVIAEFRNEWEYLCYTTK